MATVNPTITYPDSNTVKFVWALTTADADGAPIDGKWLQYCDRTVYLLGTWGGATAAVQGGDGVTYLSLTDPQGNAISKTADAIERVDELPEFTRPNLTTPGTGAAVTCTLIARRAGK